VARTAIARRTPPAICIFPEDIAAMSIPFFVPIW